MKLLKLAAGVLLCSASSLFAGTIAHYSFESNSLDSSGSALHLNQSGGSVSYAGGQFGQAANFTGSGYFWNNSTSFDISNSNFAISLWYDFSSTGFMPLVTDQSTGSDLGYAVTSYSGLVNGDLRDEVGGVVSGAKGSSGFHHLVYQRDGSTLELYIDGVLVDTQTGISSSNSSSSFAVAARNVSGGGSADSHRYVGLMDELWVFDSKLTNTEIQNLKNFNNLTGAVPEPSTYALMILGLLGVFAFRKKIRK